MRKIEAPDGDGFYCDENTGRGELADLNRHVSEGNEGDETVSAWKVTDSEMKNDKELLTPEERFVSQTDDFIKQLIQRIAY